MAGEPAPHSPPPDGKIDRDEAATLLLRVWTPETDAVFCWDGAEPWMAMLRRAVELSGGTVSPLPGGDGSALTSSFPTGSAAVRASRRLHALVTGYAVESQGRLFGVAALVCPGAVADSAELQRYLLKARPAHTLLAVKREAAPPDGAQLEEASVGGLALYALSHPYAEEAARAAETLLQKHRDRAANPETVSSPAAKASTTVGLVARVGARPRSVTAALAASIAIVAGIALARRPAKHIAPIAPPIVQPAVQPVATPQPQALPAPKAPPSPPSQKKDNPRKPSEGVEMAERPKRGRGDLSADQIRQILNRGQNALDRGCYTEAIGLYHRVLDDDPGNSSAIGGQEKARVRMRLSGEKVQCSR